MQNKKYIQFAEKNTVEVLSLSRLKEAIGKKDSKAGTYKGRDGVERMVAWPTLTADQIEKLSRSKAGGYNNTGAIPFTAIVDPHTLDAVKTFKGGLSAMQIQDSVMEVRKELLREHGLGLSRDVIRRLDMGIERAQEQTADGEFAKAVKTLDKSAKGRKKWPELLQTRFQSAHNAVVAAAEEAITAAEALEPKKAKLALRRLKSKVRGTGLTDRVKAALADL